MKRIYFIITLFAITGALYANSESYGSEELKLTNELLLREFSAGFAQAKRPVLEDLVGKKFSCQVAVAMEGEYPGCHPDATWVANETYEFDQLKYGILYTQDGSWSKEKYYLTDDAAVAISNNGYTSYLRINDEGQIFTEWTVRYNYPGMRDLTPSISDPEVSGVLTYSKCELVE